jgi:hypothetical protein
VNQLLAKIDGVDALNNILVIGTGSFTLWHMWSTNKITNEKRPRFNRLSVAIRYDQQEGHDRRGPSSSWSA